MPKQFNDPVAKCLDCKEMIFENQKRARVEDEKIVCATCWEKRVNKIFKKEEYNEPEHYHTHEIDTIEFLKRGFPPQVLTGFLIGNIIKYTQRFEYKNGEEDLMKVVDYAKRLKEWYKETHS